MKVLVIYDSVFGYTEKIAQAIGKALGDAEDVGVIKVSEVKLEQLKGLKLLIVGSPTRGLRPSEAIIKFLKSIPANALMGVRVCAFDTRWGGEYIDSFMLRFIVKSGGYAANFIANKLKRKGGDLVLPAEGFLVTGAEGPLKEGELERASIWAKQNSSFAV